MKVERKSRSALQLVHVTRFVAHSFGPALDLYNAYVRLLPMILRGEKTTGP